MRDFASSIIGLGATVLYLCAYFTGPYYGLVSTPVTFSLFVAVVVVAYALAMTFETRIVAVVTLAGGVMAPWLVSEPSSLSDAYAVFLVVLTGASLHLARRLRWEPLAQLSFVTTVSVLEVIALDGLVAPWVLGATVIAHSYLYFYFLLFDGGRLVARPTRISLAILTGEVAFVVLVCVQAFDNADVLAGLLIANAIVVSAPFFMRLSEASGARPVFLLAGGVFLGYGLLALTNLDYLGLLWGIEAVSLVYIGWRYHSASVRYEGLLLLGLSAISTLWSASQWFLDWHWDVSPAWLAMVAFVVYIEIAARLLVGDRSASPKHPRLVPWLHELETLFAALVWLGLVCIVEPEWVGVASVVPLFGILYFASFRKLGLAQVQGLAHTGILVLAIAISGLDVGSFRFGLQSTLAKVARVELFTVM